MNVLVLNGSPKARSDTMILTRSFIDGLSEAADCDVCVIDVIKKEIKPCLGCFSCWRNGDGRCVQIDDQNEILRKYVWADVIVWSFPLYCYSMPSHLKAVLDRTIPLVKMRMAETNGRVYHETLIDFSKKRTVVISGCGFPDWEGNFDALKMQCRNSFGNLTMICVPETPLLNIPEAQPAAKPLVEKFRLAGIEYASAGKLSLQTVSMLEEPMLPKQVYLAGVNSDAGI